MGRNIPPPGSPSEAETGAQQATKTRRALRQQLATARDRLRNLRATKGGYGPIPARKVRGTQLRAEDARLVSLIERLEAELAAPRRRGAARPASVEASADVSWEVAGD